MNQKTLRTEWIISALIELQFHFILHFILHFHWKSNLILKIIDCLFPNFCFVLWLCVFILEYLILLLISCFHCYISNLNIIYYLFVCLFVCFYLIIIWNTKLKSKLFNQEINITFESKKIQVELNTYVIWFSKNTIHFLICWIVIHSFNFSLWYSFKLHLNLDIYFFFWNLNWFKFENQIKNKKESK